MGEIPIRDENDTGEEDTSPSEEYSKVHTSGEEGISGSDVLPESDEGETEEVAEGAQDFDLTKEYPAEEKGDWPPSGERAHHAGGRESDIAAVPPVGAEELEEEFEFRELGDELPSDVKLELTKMHEEVRDSREKARENLDLAQRKHAELINFRKRMKQESDVYKKRAIENLLVDLFPVLDSLQKAVWNVPEEEEDSPVAEGLRRTLDLFMSILGTYGVTVIRESLVPFDPAMHSPVNFEVTEEFDDGTVLEVYQYGFKLADRIVRPAMVKVSKCEEEEEAEAGAPPAEESEKGEAKYASLDEMIEVGEDE